MADQRLRATAKQQTPAMTSEPAKRLPADQEALEELVTELMKDQPSQTIVKKLSNQLGMPYSGDSMTQINTVLNSMNSVYLRANRGKELES